MCLKVNMGLNQGDEDELSGRILEKEKLEKIKCVVIGDGGCGKTSLLTVYAKGEFPEDYVPTVFENYSKEVTLNEKAYVVMLWDTAGQEEYDRLRPLSYDSVDVVIICYDVTTAASFENVTVRWVPEARHFCPEAEIVLVGCKTDLKLTKSGPEKTGGERGRSKSVLYKTRVIPSDEGERLAKSIKASEFVECSAKLNDNVTKVFDASMRQALKRRKDSSICDCCNLF